MSILNYLNKKKCESSTSKARIGIGLVHQISTPTFSRLHTPSEEFWRKQRNSSKKSSKRGVKTTHSKRLLS